MAFCTDAVVSFHRQSARSNQANEGSLIESASILNAIRQVSNVVRLNSAAMEPLGRRNIDR